MRKRNFIEIIILLIVIMTGSLSKNEVLTFIKGYQSIVGGMIASIIAVIGWFYAYDFNNKVQDQRLKNDITNTARKEITEAIREYQKNLSKIMEEISHLKFLLNNDIDINWDEKLSKYDIMFYSVNKLWNENLEDYQIIFPETKDVRIQLQERDFDITGMLTEFKSDLTRRKMMIGKDRIKDLIENANLTINEYLLDQMCLMEDLRIYLQNRALSQITGNIVPERKPKDSSTAIILMNESTGYLEIYNNKVGVSALSKILLKHNN
ncbi:MULTISPECIES: hypothetical protein [Pelosinus]|uniref:Uncharacterized protein n=1 Tax=Pelosinus fermentans B4 TaxID=1149862 RepID=I9L5S1_9FIRM|nr:MULTISPECIES: hypothetical protein [Pelosinus]EIW15709.1 hypothetical protein FB4_1398 [Pelosinus fermentans B4]EIW26601.1 hypothetical protein FA11_1605 [Pelosinus fermentans A11]